MRLVLLLVLFSFVNCSDEKEEAIPDVLMPGKTGSWWKYNIKSYNKTESPDTSFVRTMYYGESVSYKEKTGYKVENILPLGFGFSILTKKSTYYLNTESGLFLGEKDESEYTYPPQGPHFSKYFKYPTYVGDSALVSGTIIKTLSMEEEIRVPYGTFNCIKYIAILNDDTLGTIWFKPKLGIVKIKETWWSANIVSELTDTKLSMK